MKKYINETRKPVDEIIKKNADFFISNKNCDDIYILGFSFGDVDLDEWGDVDWWGDKGWWGEEGWYGDTGSSLLSLEEGWHGDDWGTGKGMIITSYASKY